MPLSPWNWFVLLLKLLILSLFLSPFVGTAMALDELFETYSSPQALMMGNAFTADAQGHVANYTNPAGLAKATKREWEIIPIALEGVSSLSGFSRAISAHSFGIFQTAREMQKHPGEYTYNRLNFIPATSKRGFGIAFLGAYENAGRSDGTNYDVHAKTDIGTSVGAAVNLAGNLLQLGFAAKLLVRNELNGTFLHDNLDSDDAVKSRMKEGVGAGGDVGLSFTFPNKYLPTISVAWRDALNSQFFASSHILNGLASGTPDPIKQSVNSAFSLHPYFSKMWRGIFAIELKHFERTDLSFGKRFHFGFQLSNEKSFYLWAGLNQLFWTGGIGYRVRGGNFELGSYAEDVGSGNSNQEDRRILLRYTIGF